jgi:hypothetical protein
MNNIPLNNKKKSLALHLVTAGHTVKAAAEQVGLNYESLRKAAYREKWPTPARVDREVARKLPSKVTEVLAAEGVDQKTRYVQRMADGLADKISLAVGAMDTETLLKRSREIETLDRISRRTLELDEDEQQSSQSVNIAVLGDISTLPSEIEYYRERKQAAQNPEQ